MLERSANFEEPVDRLTHLAVAFAASFNSAKMRKKKQFNPMLGETYELVTDNVKLVSEKI